MEITKIKKTIFYLENEETYFIRFIEALSNVEDLYIQYETYKYKGEQLVPIIKRAEKAFAYELYHQYRLIMPNDKNYILNGEVYKDNRIFQNENVKNCYPDLILHRNVGYIEENTQYFLCEIKMSSNNKLVEDLAKLTKLKRQTKLSFKYYIFLCVGLDDESLKKRILKWHKKNEVIRFDGDIMCVCRKNKQIIVFRLKEILPQELLW